MPGGRAFSEDFAHYLAPPDEIIQAGMTAGMVVFDTNVLLSLYRFASDARGELFSAFERIGERAWIPHQVSLEFHKNRPEVVLDYGSVYASALEAIGKCEEQVQSDLRQRIQLLAKRTALSPGQLAPLLRSVDEALVPVRKGLEQLRDSHGLSGSLSDDPILERLQRIFRGKVGSPVDDVDHASMLEEADRRIKEELPPGYKDKRPGDYLVWRQTLNEARDRADVTVLVFVTEDVKDDWYLRVKGRVLFARPELDSRSAGNSRRNAGNDANGLFPPAFSDLP